MSERTNETAFARLQRAAIEFHGVVITPDAAAHLRFLPADTNQQVASKLAQLAQELLAPDSLEALHLALGLSSTLTAASHHRFLSDLGKFLRSQVLNLRAPDIRTSVLETWLLEIETSNSSSVAADGDSGDSGATDPRADTVTITVPVAMLPRLFPMGGPA